MNDLTSLANVAEIVGAIIVVGGLIFAVLQMRQTRQQRRELAAIELFRFFGNPKFTVAYKRILRLPAGLSANDIEDGESDLEDAAMLISATMESIGVMTFQRIVPYMVVYNLIGASCPALWRKLAPWVQMLRQEQNELAVFEWFQWLAERLEQGHSINPNPAYLEHHSWQPANLTNQL
ncbi:MAG: hypothetical protein O3A13_06085 [Proteobacteria bacterium]|nr:hypothetical protein [Pseudomonadota bacterium]MDA0993184.1 hypothetical protein [Pseudomonadota bacterium]